MPHHFFRKLKLVSISAAKHIAFVLLVSAMAAKAASATSGIALKQVSDGFCSPVVLIPYDDKSGRLLVVDQIGTIQMLSGDAKLPFLDLRDRLTKLNKGFDERGLLGLALHPKFKSNRKLYVVYSAPLRDKSLAEWDHTMTVSEFKVYEKDRLQVDPASERIVLQIDKPWFNHNGGCLAFGPDGYLYISVGDGGNKDDTGRGHSPQGNGQDTSVLLGKVLRIDVNYSDAKLAYAIPADNPFAKGGGRPEIFAYGLRNTWRMSFDRGGHHELFGGDVGQNMFEEINIIVKGGNYGWRTREGFHYFDPKTPNKPPEDGPKTGPDGKPFIDPILEYKNINGWRNDPEARGISVTGGYVYRGKALKQLVGRYVFADWSRNFGLPDGVMYVAVPPTTRGEKRWSLAPLELVSLANGKIGAFIVALGQGAEGELYILTNASNGLVGTTGKVFKLVKADL